VLVPEPPDPELLLVPELPDPELVPEPPLAGEEPVVGDVVVVLVGRFVIVVVVVVVVVVVAVGFAVVADTNSVVPEPAAVSRLVLVEDELACAAVNCCCAAVRLWSAWSSESCAEVESSVASSWPLVTCWPAFTYTCDSVPLVWKFTLTSAPAWTFPLPDTVDCTIPFSAVTICVEVRAELVGGPICASARAAIATAATASMYRCHGRFWRLLMARLHVVGAHRATVAPRAEFASGRS
jgi:hypothetical protein